jgi:hypothetical protein
MSIQQAKLSFKFLIGKIGLYFIAIPIYGMEEWNKRKIGKMEPIVATDLFRRTTVLGI